MFRCCVQYQAPVLAFLTDDDEHHRIALVDLAAVKPEPAVDEKRGALGVDHVAYPCKSVEQLIDDCARSRSRG